MTLFGDMLAPVMNASILGRAHKAALRPGAALAIAGTLAGLAVFGTILGIRVGRADVP